MRAAAALAASIAVALAASAAEELSRRAGAFWQDGLLIGDGATAALAYAPAHLEWMINRNDVFDSRVFECDYVPHDEVMACVATNDGHSVAFLGPRERPTIRGPKDGSRLTLSMSAAVLRVRFWYGTGWAMPAIPRAMQTLDTRRGELAERIESPSFSHEAVSFVERSRDVMVVGVGSRARAVVDLSRPDDPRYDSLAMDWKERDGVVCFSQKMPGGETYAVALTSTGKVTTVGRTAHFEADGRSALFLAVRTTRDAADPAAAAVAAVRAAASDGFERLRADNAEWWRRFWQGGARASFASEPEIDTQWHVALHNLASQFGSAPMPALNGLVYGPPGDGTGGVASNCFVHDQNVQIPMMPFFPLGHAEFVRAFVKTYTDALPELERRTREVFGVDGVYLPLNMNHNGREAPIADYRYTLCGGAYSGLVLAQSWWYTHDESLLRETYPLLKKFIRFYTETMTRDADGTCHFIWSVPPEIFTGSRDDTATIACLKPCLEVAIEAATRFGVDAADAALWRDILAHYPRFARHSDGGWWCGPEIPDDHYMYGGHLFYPFFPSEADTDEETAKKTLDYTWKYAVEISVETPRPHPVHEWSALYTGMARTRLYGGAEGWRALTDFYDHFAKPNGLFSHNSIVVTDMTRDQAAANAKRVGRLMRRNYHGKVVPFGRGCADDLTPDPDSKRVVAPVLEGGAAFLMLASEALCQSWGGEIRLFPSVPANFTGRFENFRVRGGFRVSAEMREGRLVDYAVRGVGSNDAVRVTCPADPGFVQLPGEPAWKAPLPPGPFPDVLTAYVFRNWGLVSPQTLAETIGAKKGEVDAIAAELGLAPNPRVSSLWRSMGYATILRRNWHLVPYPQLMKLVGMSRRELREALVEDDCLGTKLGIPKPDCPPLVYSAEAAAAGRAARQRLRRMLGQEGVKIVDPGEEPRFRFLDDFGSLPPVARSDDPRFDLRMIYPFSANYGDPFAEDGVPSCPEGLLADLAARGINAVWFHVVLSTLTTDAKYPEFGDGAARRLANLRGMVERAGRHGIKVILYINEPRAQPSAFFDRPGRESMRGSAVRGWKSGCCRCLRDPDTLRWLRDSLTQLFRAVPGLGGVFTITMSENPTHCGSQFRDPAEIDCPRCRGTSVPDMVVAVNKAIYEGVKVGNPDATVCFYDTAWELLDDPVNTVVPFLPKGGRLVSWSEKLLPFSQCGLDLEVNEYSISHPGPGPSGTRYWAAAKKAGLKADAKLQVNTCWEICAVPYLPAMDLVAEHAYNLSTGVVDGVMLSWSLGGYPGPNLALFSRFSRGANDCGEMLDGLAAELYGEEARDAVRAAWRVYSEAYRNYPMQWQTVYYSPVQIGPANLLWAKRTNWSATMVNNAYDAYDQWTDGYRKNRAAWTELMGRTADGFDAADRLWAAAVAKMRGARRKAGERDAGVFRAATLHFRTSHDQAQFILARDRGDRAGMRRWAERELATAKEFLKIVRADSRLGYESSNRYMYVPNDILEKILNCRATIDGVPR